GGVALLAWLALVSPALAADTANVPVPASPPIDASLAVQFQAGDGARTVVLGTVSVPAAQAVKNGYGFYNLQLEGEVQVDGRPYDHFAYRFDVPANGDSG